MSIVSGLIKELESSDFNDSLEYQILIDNLSSKERFMLFQEISLLKDCDVQDTKRFFREILHIELSLDCILGFFKKYPDLICIEKTGKLNSRFEQDYVRSLFCFYIGINPWPLRTATNEEKENFILELHSMEKEYGYSMMELSKVY